MTGPVKEASFLLLHLVAEELIGSTVPRHSRCTWLPGMRLGSWALLLHLVVEYLLYSATPVRSWLFFLYLVAGHLFGSVVVIVLAEMFVVLPFQ